MQRSILSVGAALYEVLNQELKGTVTKVFPVVTDEAELPYVCYRRESLETIPTKPGISTDTAVVSIACFAATYGESVALAERVRQILDNRQWSSELVPLILRSIVLADAKEEWADDAYIQTLYFKIKA